jgi:Protein of unknown function (DUF2975)
MKTLGQKSFASFLSASLDVARWVLIVLLAIMLLVGIPAYIVDAYIDLPWVTSPPPGVVLWPGMLVFVVSLLVALVVVMRLRRIFATLIAGDPFVPQNAVHLRVIWMTLAAYEIMRMAITSGAVLTLNLSGGASTTTGLSGGLHINGGLWIAVAVLVVLAEVFREGARLRDEQKLTI